MKRVKLQHPSKFLLRTEGPIPLGKSVSVRRCSLKPGLLTRPKPYTILLIPSEGMVDVLNSTDPPFGYAWVRLNHPCFPGTKDDRIDMATWQMKNGLPPTIGTRRPIDIKGLLVQLVFDTITMDPKIPL